MSDSKSSYRQIIKTTTLFGGVQIIQILTSIARGKIVAILLGTAGMGINTLLNASLTLIVQFASLGINFSAVRDISQANNSGDVQGLGKIVKIFNILIYFCAALGLFTMVIGSYWLSKYTFGNGSYTMSFIWLSLAVTFTILNSGNITLLQGMQNLKDMARASLVGSLGGLILSLPFYYLYSEKGIIPALIAAAFFSYCASKFYSRKIRFEPKKISFNSFLSEGTGMAKLGIAMMVSTLIGSVVNYLINSYIGKFGSIAEVGLYGAGVSITNQYVGVIFTAMAVDYFPRLSAVCDDEKKIDEVVNQQAEIVVLIILPLLIIMILSAPLLIKILLSKQFLDITTFIYWVSFGLLFKAASFAMGYISFAKGDKKTFFLFEGVTGSVLILTCNIAGYTIGGLNGLAISVLISYIIYFFAVLVLTRKLYNFHLKNSFIKIFIKAIVLVLTILILMLLKQNLISYIVSSVILVVALYLSYYELNKRIGIRSLIMNRIKR